tara:strand:+ start:1342 stop:1785 length:444 start_codon:yes stop_codon:yes gene_type:complete
MAKKKKAIVKKTRKTKRKPIVKKVIKKPFAKKVQKPFIRYSFEIDRFVVSKTNILLEIYFDYKGTLVIPKALKETVKPGNHTLSGSFIIPKKIEDPVLLTDCNLLTKTQVITFLKTYLRDEYIKGLEQLIEDELFPDVKIIDKLPWK